MQKTLRFSILLLLGTVMIFSIAGCNAVTQSKVEDLQSQIEELNDKLAEMDEQIRERDATIEDLNEQIKNRDERIEDLQKELRDIVSGEKELGPFYSLQEAYHYGLLTQEDLKSIAYYHNGGRTYNEGIMSEAYTPAPKAPEVLNAETEIEIKSAAAEEYREKYNIKFAEADGFTITQYYGTYNDCIAVMTRDNYSGAADVVWFDSVAGVNIYYSNGKSIQIWRKAR